MKSKTKNWIVYSFQLLFFVTLTFIIIFIEFVWLFEGLIPLDYRPTTRTAAPPVQEIVFSIFFVTLMVLNLGMASFSLYTFIFILHIFDANPANTAPMCPLAIDCAMINFLLYHYSLHNERYFNYLAQSIPFSIYFYVPSLIYQIPEIFMAIALFTIFMNLQFGIEGIYKSRVLKTNKLTDFTHILLLLNGVLPLFIIIAYTNFQTITLVGFILSMIIAHFLIGLINFFLRKKKMRYPIEAIALWRFGKIIYKKDREEINNEKN